MNKMELFEQKQMGQKEMPKFNIGDTVRVYVKIPEADKIRVHPFEGTVISRRGSGMHSTFTIRKVSFGEGVERVFPLFSPSIDKIEILRSSKVKRSKLYYLRQKAGKKAKLELKEEEKKEQEQKE